MRMENERGMRMSHSLRDIVKWSILIGNEEIHQWSEF
jgi:hypothetical protein